jgi:hypothetical protein
MSDPALGLTMLGLIVVAIMMGFPTAFTLMGLGMLFGHFKTVIPVAGVLVMLQGLAEMVRCVLCLRTGAWPARQADVAEIDVIDTQLSHSEYVDEESRRAAMEGAHAIEEAARHRSVVDKDG